MLCVSHHSFTPYLLFFLSIAFNKSFLSLMSAEEKKARHVWLHGPMKGGTHISLTSNVSFGIIPFYPIGELSCTYTSFFVYLRIDSFIVCLSILVA